MILAIVKLQTPPKTVDTMLVVARRPCWEKDEVTYGERLSCTELRRASTKVTR
jgi:hypothetical protein